ncbi:hypothetical protein RhiirA5_424169 [Rhizophagus irregularis]|uniref:Uncharacterized protein n=1 Tax=Rhizophagus irregularis TaxID=588596 RepID=A0A2N0P8L0_9GLOM|nr:hypothetical protein RhiirA5_424169 [Rhizophagus irregularis]CAB5183255.1 unnamed protein product [Rhizophagus irregularis]CAB5303691.1 unnamed protein product [Rhizophagus irregularis]
MLSHLYSLNIDINSVNSNDLYEMAQICKNLNELIVDNCSQDIPGLIYLIDAQNLTVNRNYSIDDVLERFLESYRGRKLLSFNIYYKRNTIEHAEIVRKYIAERIVEYSNLSKY